MLHTLAQGQVSDHMSGWIHVQNVPSRKICFCLQHATLWQYTHVYVWNCGHRN